MANKHMPYDLAQMQSLPLEAKIRMTKQRIRDWYDHWDGQVYVSFSGGKDSTVLKHIVDSMYDDVPALFVNTGLEYPEIQKFAMSQKNVVTVRPKMRFDEVIKTYGYPVISKEVAHKIHDANNAKSNGIESYALRQFAGNYVSKNGKTNAYSVVKWKFLLDASFKISHKCCDEMKKKPSKLYEKQTGRKLKPTDIWTNHPNPQFKPMCKNGDPCHVPAPRGSHTAGSSQGLKNSKERSVIPEALCKHIVEICEDKIID